MALSCRRGRVLSWELVMSMGSIPPRSQNLSIPALIEDAISGVKDVAEDVSSRIANTTTKVLGVFDPMRFSAAHSALTVDPAEQTAGKAAVDGIAALVK